LTPVALVLRLINTGHGMLQADAAEALSAAQEECRGALVVSSRPCVSRLHVFGWSLDLDVAGTLAALSQSKSKELIIAGRDRQSLGRWMRRFGWSHEKKTPGHFDICAGHRTLASRVEGAYGPDLSLNNVEVQMALAKISGMTEADFDGVLDGRWDQAASTADQVLGTNDRGSFSMAFRRALALATAEVMEVAVEKRF